MNDPIMIFMLYPLAVFYLGFLESVHWVKVNAE